MNKEVSENIRKSTPLARSIEDFDPRSGQFIERAIFNNRLIVILVCLLITSFLSYKSLGLNVSAAFNKMMPSKHEYIINYLDNEKDLTNIGNSLRVTVENTQGSIFEPEYLNVVKALTDELFLLPGVDRPYLKSLWTPSVRWTGVTEEGLDGGSVMPDTYDGSQRSIEEFQANVERSGEIGQLVAADLKSSVILVPLREIAGQELDYHQLSNTLEELRTRYQSDSTKIHITGFAKVVGDLIDGLYEVVIFFGITIMLATLVLYYYTRCLRSTSLVVICSLIAVVWLLGLLPTLGYDLDPYSILVPFLVFAIGMSHGAQKMNGILQDVGRGIHKLLAARYTFRRLFLAGITALASDAIGFAVLMVIDIPVIQDLAVTASLGVATLIFTNLMLLPVMLSYVGVNEKAAARSVFDERTDLADKAHQKHPLWNLIDHLTRRKYATLLLVLCSVLGVGATLLSFETKIGDTGVGAPELRADSRYNLDNKFMVDHYAASSDIYIVMVKTGQYGCALYETVSAVDGLESELQALEGVESTNSLAALSKIANAGMNEGNMKWYDIPRSQGMLNAIVTRAPRELFNQGCDLLVVYAYLKDHKADTLNSVVSVVERFADRHGTDQLEVLNAAGNAGIEAATNIVVKQANVQMLVLVYSAVIALAFLTFRSWAAVACAVIPLMLTSILCQALMVLLDIGVKVSTLPVIALGVGIGVDYALYIMTVTLSRLREGDSLSQAYYRALTFTGKIVILTGLTLGVAVATWVFSPIKFQADMGILLAFMFIFNMLGALLLLPALAYFLVKPEKIIFMLKQ
uniref:efflux RND transporter permease subunit n=1 Tax=Marinobacterium profundum TaxID=1714300 RepID=UPI0008306AF3|nr:MMPL family transporter [Marinobacterium profundum]